MRPFNFQVAALSAAAYSLQGLATGERPSVAQRPTPTPSQRDAWRVRSIDFPKYPSAPQPAARSFADDLTLILSPDWEVKERRNDHQHP